MDHIFQCLTDLTAQRDHTLLYASMLGALQATTAAASARVIEIDRDALSRDVAWFIDDGKGVELAGRSSTAQGSPIDEPALQECIQERRNIALEKDASGVEILWLPVYRADDEAVCFELRSRQGFSGHELDTINGLCRIFRNVLALLDENQKDPLTGFFNRKTFDDRFKHVAQGMVDPRILSGAPALDRSIAQQWIAVIDIDHFKKINDTFGRLYGDEVLLLLSNVMKTAFRTGDSIYRFGGEEFVVLLQKATYAQAKEILERVRTSIEAYPFPQVGRVTVSAGVVAIRAGQNPVSVLGMADEALYYAKQNGRNQCGWYEDLVAAGKLQVRDTGGEMELF